MRRGWSKYMEVKDRLLSKKGIIEWAAAILLFIVLAVFVSLSAAIVALLFAVAFILHIDPGVPFALSLFLLALSPLMYVIDQISTAVVLVNWAYWFLAIGVAVMFYQHVKAERREETSEG